MLKATDLAKQALDPYDFSVANNGKAKALRTISIIDKAFNSMESYATYCRRTFCKNCRNNRYRADYL